MHLQSSQHDQLILHLPGFSGMRETFNVTSTPAGLFRSAIWTQSSVEGFCSFSCMKLAAAEDVPADTLIRVFVPREAEMLLPEEGIRVNDVRYTIASTAVSGPVRPTPFKVAQGVGSFGRTTNITCFEARAGETVALALDFRAFMPLGSGDEVSLIMEAFGGGEFQYEVEANENRSNVSLNVFPAHSVCRISWKNNTLNMSICNRWPAGQRYSIFIPKAWGLRLPSTGLRVGGSYFWISSRASLGDVRETPVFAFTPVGALGRESLELSFDPMRAGEVVSLDVRFLPLMSLATSDLIVLHLPGCFLVNGTSQLTANASDRLSFAWDQGTSNLSIKLRFPLIGNITQDLKVPASLGLALPREGIRRNQESILFAVISVQGNILPRIFDQILPIGAFSGGVNLHFDPLIIGHVASIHLSFRVTSVVFINDTFTFHLPNLFSHSSHNEIVAELDHFDAVWNDSQQDLSFRSKTVFDPYQNISITAPLTMNISIPWSGLPSTYVATVTADVKEGPILPTPVKPAQALGALRTSKLTFSQPLAGQPSVIEIMFSAYMMIGKGEVVMLRLMDFEGPGGKLEVNGSEFEGASWNLTTETLALTASRLIPAGQEVYVLVRKSDAVRLPTAGVPLGDQLQISSDALDGPVPWTDVEYVQPVGTFLYSEIEMSPHRVGHDVVLSLSFNPAMEINAGSNISLTVASLSGTSSPANCSLSSLAIETIYQATCAWSQEKRTLEVQVLDTLESNRTYRLQVSTPLFLAAGGISYDDEGVTISCDSPAGPVLPTRIMYIPSIRPHGNFVTSKISYLPRRADVPVTLLFSFAVDVSLYTGDVVSLLLPKFSASSNNCSVDSNGQVWTDCQFQGEVLTFTLTSNLRPHEIFDSTIAGDAGILLPPDGIRLGDNFLQASVQAVAGSVVSAPIGSQDAVGTLSGATLTFSPAQTSQQARVMLSFKLRNTIQVSEQLTLRLPDFTSDANASCNLSAFVSKDLNFTFRTVQVGAKWLSSSSDLLIDFLQTVMWEDNKFVSIVFPPACGIHLPPSSLARDSNALTIASNARFGPFDPTPLQFHLALGKFSRLSLSFGDAFAGEPANFTIRVASELALARDDVITIYLPGFRCDDPAAVVSPDRSTVNVTLNWLQNTCSAYQRFCSTSQMAVLSVILLQDVASNEEIVLEILSGSRPETSTNFSIFLPEKGVREFEADLKAAANTKVNPIYPTNFDSVQPVGYLGQNKKLRLTFPARANRTGGMQIEIFPEMVIRVNDELFLYLPQFLGPSFANKTIYDADHNVLALVSWDSAGTLLMLSMKQNLLPGKLDITLQSDLGLIFPVKGLRANESAIKINATVVSGSVLRKSFDEVQALGAFEKVKFDFEKFYSSFSCYMTLWPGDELVFYLPTSMNVFAQGLQSSCPLSASFDAAANQLRLSVDKKITRMETCDFVSAAYQSFTTFPVLAETLIWVEVKATEGYIPPTQIDDVITKTPFVRYPVVTLQANPLARDFNRSLVFTLDENFFVNSTITNVTLFYVGATYLTLDELYNETFLGSSRMPLVLNEASLFEEQVFQLQFSIAPQGLWRNQNGFWLNFRKNDEAYLFPCQNLPFGGFEASALTFDLVQGKIIISVTTTMDLVAFDSLLVNLNNFESTHDVLAVVSDPPGVVAQALWDGVSVLQLVIDGRNASAGHVVHPRRRQLNVTLPLGPAGLTLPRDGVRSEDQTITLGSNASLGPTNAKSFGLVQPVGCFRNGSALEFFSEVDNRSLVGHPVGVRVSFKACMQIAPGDAVYVRLPGFSVVATISPVAITGSLLELNEFKGEVALFLARGNISQDEQVVLEIPPSVGFRLPFVGVRLDDASYTISTNASEGPVKETSFDRVQAVGSFPTILLAFASESRAGRPVNVTFNFTTAMDVLAGENVSLLLPGWQADDFVLDSSLLTRNNTSILVVLSWAQADERLTMRLGDRLAAGDWAYTYLTSELGLIVSPAGIQQKLNGIVASSDARLGRVNFFPVDVRNKFGAFLGTKIYFAPAVADVGVEFTISFEPQMDVLEGESIHIVMGFLRRIRTGPVSFLSNITVVNFSSWNASTKTLALRITNVLYAEEAVTVSIPLSEGFLMSPLGLSEQSAPLISTAASRGFVSPTLIQHFPLIARIFVAKLIVQPPIADFDAEISLDLSVSVRLLPGDVVSMRLPGFSQSVLRAPQPVNASFNYSVAWNESDHSVTWTFHQEIAPELVVTLAGPTDMFLRTPSGGLLLNQHDVLLELRAEQGSVLWTPLTHFVSFGSFVSLPQLVFLNPYTRAAVVSGLELQFQLSMDLVPGDTLSVLLPGFDVPKSAQFNLSSAVISNGTSQALANAFSGSVSSIFYSYGNYEIVVLTENANKSSGVLVELKCRREIHPNSSVVLRIGEEASITLPPTGVPGKEGFAMSVNASIGPIRATPFGSVQTVGILSNTSMVFGDSPAAGETGNITLSFVFSFNLTEGVKIVVRLPEFLNLSSHGKARLMAENDLNVDVSFQMLEMYVLELSLPQNILVPPYSLVSITIVEMFLLPFLGVGKDSQINMTISQGSSSITFSEVQTKQPVGAILSENMQFDCVNVLGDIGFTLSFIPTMSIQAAEEVALFLGGFYVATSQQFSVASSQVQQVIVEPLASGVKVVFAMQARSAGSQVVLRVDPTVGIKAPNVSFCQDHVAVLLTISAISGPVTNKALSSVLFASARSHSPVPGQPVNFAFELLSTIKLRANDTIMFALSPYAFASTTSSNLGSVQVMQLCEDASVALFQTNVVWNASLSSFVLHIPADIQRGSRIMVNISTTSGGLKFPLQGIPLSKTNQFSVKILQEYNNYASCLKMLTPFGGFLSPTNITFTNQVPGGLTGFQVVFEMSMNLYQNDRIEMYLQGFDILQTGGFSMEQSCMVIYGQQQPFSFTVSAEKKSGGVAISFTSNQYVAGYQKVDLPVPVEAGLVLPKGEAVFGYSIDLLAVGLDGITRNLEVIGVPKLGSFLPSYLKWNATGKETADLRLFFTPHVGLQGGETMSLRMLPFLASSANFSSVLHLCDQAFSSGCRFDNCFATSSAMDLSSQCCGATSVQAVSVSCSWNASSSSLTFQVPPTLQTSVNGSEVTQLSPCSLHIPEGNIRFNSSFRYASAMDFTLSIDSKSAPVLDEPIRNVSFIDGAIPSISVGHFQTRNGLESVVTLQLPFRLVSSTNFSALVTTLEPSQNMSYPLNVTEEVSTLEMYNQTYFNSEEILLNLSVQEYYMDVCFGNLSRVITQTQRRNFTSSTISLLNRTIVQNLTRVKSFTRMTDPVVSTNLTAIKHNDTIALHLPELSGASFENETVDVLCLNDGDLMWNRIPDKQNDCLDQVQGCTCHSFGKITAQWNSSLHILSLTVYGNMSGSVQIRIPDRLGLELSLLAPVTAVTDAWIRTERIPFLKLTCETAVNATVLESSMQFGKVSAGAVAEVSVLLSLSIKMKKGDSLYISMPGFQATDLSRSPLIVSSDSWSLAAYWENMCNFVGIKVVANQEIPSKASIQMKFPQANGIKIPVQGVEKDSYDIQVSMVTSEVVMSNIPFKTVQPVGSFASSPVISFARVNSSEAALFSLNMTFHMAVRKTDVVELVLPGFSCSSQSCQIGNEISVLLTSPLMQGPIGFTAKWNETSKVLRMLLPVNLMSDQDVTLQSSSPLLLPDVGVSWQGSGISISLNSSLGSIQPVLVTVIPIGSVRSSSISFVPAVAGSPSRMIFQFVPGMDMRIGDLVELSLPQFFNLDKSLPKVRRVVCTENVCVKIRNGIWDENQQLMTLTIFRQITARELVTFEIPFSFGLCLPEKGFRADSSSINITILSNSYVLVGPLALVTVQPVGGFVQSSITFNPNVPNVNTNVVLRLIPSARQLRGRSLYLTMPGFSNARVDNFSVTSFPASFVRVARWQASTFQVQFFIENDVAELTQIVLSIDASVGFQIPSTSMQTSIVFKLQADMPDGQMPQPLPIRSNLSSGQLFSFSSSKLSFREKYAGKPSTLVLEFSTPLFFVESDQLLLLLPGFSRRTGDFACYNITTVPQAALKVARWIQSENTLVLNFSKYFEESTQFQMVLSSACGIELPFDGVSAGGSGIMLTAVNAAGQIPSTPVSVVEPVGSFGYSTELIFSAYGPQRQINFTLRFSPKMQLHPGDELILNLPGFVCNESIVNLSSNVEGFVSLGYWRQYEVIERVQNGSGSRPLFYISEDIVCENSTSLVEVKQGSDPWCAPKVTETVHTRCWNVSKRVNTSSLNTSVSYYSEALPKYELRIPVRSVLGPCQVVTLQIVRNDSFYLPLEGVRANYANLTLQAKAVAGDVPPTSVVSSMAVGAESNCNFGFFPQTAGRSTQLDFKFSSLMPLFEEDLIVLRVPGLRLKNASVEIPGWKLVTDSVSNRPYFLNTATKQSVWASDLIMDFEREYSTINTLTNVSYSVAGSKGTINSTISNVTRPLLIVSGPAYSGIGTWCPLNEELTIVLSSAIPAGSTSTFKIEPLDSVFFLPDQGLTPDKSVFFRVVSRSGDVQESSCKAAQITAFVNSSLETSVNMSTQFAEIHLRFIASIPLQVGDLMIVYLPQFTSSNDTFKVELTSGNQHWSCDARFVQENFTLFVNNSMAVDSARQVELVVPDYLHFKIPHDGIRVNDTRFLIGLESSSIGIPLAIFRHVIPVGALKFSSVTMLPIRIAEDVEMNISFSPYMNLDADCSVHMELPEFALQSKVSRSLIPNLTICPDFQGNFGNDTTVTSRLEFTISFQFNTTIDVGDSVSVRFMNQTMFDYEFQLAPTPLLNLVVNAENTSAKDQLFAFTDSVESHTNVNMTLFIMSGMDKFYAIPPEEFKLVLIRSVLGTCQNWTNLSSTNQSGNTSECVMSPASTFTASSVFTSVQRNLKSMLEFKVRSRILAESNIQLHFDKRIFSVQFVGNVLDPVTSIPKISIHCPSGNVPSTAFQQFPALSRWANVDLVQLRFKQATEEVSSTVQIDGEVTSKVWMVPGDSMSIVLQDFSAPCNREPCDPGFYRSNCSGGLYEDTICLPCSFVAPPNSRLSVANPVNSDSCSFLCKEGYFRNRSICQHCNTSRCPLGYYREICGFGRDSDAVCKPCQFHNHTAFNASDSANCSYYCLAGYYLSGDTCLPCNTSRCESGYFRQQCQDSSRNDAECLPCSDGPNNSSKGPAIIYNEDTCDVLCHAGFWRLQTSHSPLQYQCVACNTSACPVGTFRNLSTCHGDQDAKCMPCSGSINGHSTFLSPGIPSTENKCEWECLPGFWRNNSECVRCSWVNCRVGEFFQPCSKMKPGECMVCENAPPNSHYLRSTYPASALINMEPNQSYVTNNCSWACNDGFRKINDTCIPCSNLTCAQNYYLGECIGNQDTVCVECLQTAVPNSISVSVAVSKCRRICQSGFWHSAEMKACVPCTSTATFFSSNHSRCPTGYRWDTSVCRGNVDSQCTECPPLNFSLAVYIDSNSSECQWVCPPGYFKSNETCVVCNQSKCPAGQYRTFCPLNSTKDSTCHACSEGPRNSTLQVASEIGFDSCPFVCNEGFFQSVLTLNGSSSDVCQACNTSMCAVGEYRSQCSHYLGDSHCVRCTNSPVHSHYVGSGFPFDADNCSWQCDVGYWRNGSSCVACADFLCSSGYYRTACTERVDSICTPCANEGIPPHSEFTNTLEYSIGVQSSNKSKCFWKCVEDFWWNGTACTSCDLVPCDKDQYKTACMKNLDSGCKLCPMFSPAVFPQLPATFNALDYSLLNMNHSIFRNVYIKHSRNDRYVELFFVLGSAVPARETIKFSIPASVQIRIPEVGMSSCNRYFPCSFQLHSNFSAGVVEDKCICDFNALGYLNMTSIRFDPPVAGETCSIYFRFLPSIPMNADDVMILSLPGFGGMDFEGILSTIDIVPNLRYNMSNFTNLSETNNTNYFANSSELNSTNSSNSSFANSSEMVMLSWSLSKRELYIKFQSTLRNGHLYQTVIPSSAGLSLPATGIYEGLGKFDVRIDSPRSLVRRTHLNQIQRVGSFNNSVAINFEVIGQDLVSFFEISFTPFMLIQAGERLEFRLHHFIFSESFNAQSNVNVIFNIKYARNDSVMEARPSLDLPVGKQVRIIISPQDLVALPPLGIRQDSLFTVSSDVLEGPVIQEVISKFPILGSFGESPTLEVAFQNGNDVFPAISLKFSVYMEMQQGQVIRLHLPGFEGISKRRIIYRDGTISIARWDSTLQILEFILHLPVHMGQDLQISVGSSFALTLPPDGIQQRRLFLSSDAPSGPVVASFLDYPPIGSIKEAIVKYAPCHVDSSEAIPWQNICQNMSLAPSSNVAISIELTFHMPIQEGDNITVVLHGFQGIPNTQSFIAQVSNISMLYGQGQQLDFVIEKQYPSNSKIHLLLPIELGIRLPADGVTENQTDLT
eukprot:764531-Hanusia_phi.AAC.4